MLEKNIVVSPSYDPSLCAVSLNTIDQNQCIYMQVEKVELLE